jgi:hypothetical protein
MCLTLSNSSRSPICLVPRGPSLPRSPSSVRRSATRRFVEDAHAGGARSDEDRCMASPARRPRSVRPGRARWRRRVDAGGRRPCPARVRGPCGAFRFRRSAAAGMARATRASDQVGGHPARQPTGERSAGSRGAPGNRCGR